MSELKRFPIQGVGTIPWEAAERAHTAYAARYGSRQSLEYLSQRGGFGLAEFAMLYWAATGHPQNDPWPKADDLDWQQTVCP